ncbi:hypothetical protein KJ359_011864 [Pestalotiopsis sp. 9143b]|nr:hypothetical protein KJ359_011864 [Pestalotiopsis sp. 9143b]
MPVKSKTKAPKRFDYFSALPREIQLLVWEFYEVDSLKVRHVFGHYEWDKFKYGDTDPKHFSEVWSTKWNRKPKLSDFAVVDPAVAPRLEIPLPRHTRWLRVEDPGNACHPYYTEMPFPDFQAPKRTFARHTWMNFKLDSFCFHPMKSTEMPSTISPELAGFFACLKRDSSFMHFQTWEFDMSHWFWRIQHLELLFENPSIPLGSIDKFILEAHPSLKTISLVVVKNSLFCSKPRPPPHPDHQHVAHRRRRRREPEEPRQIDILTGDVESIVSKARDRSAHSDDGEGKQEVVGKILELQQEVRDLFKHRAASVRPLVQITIMGYYHVRQDNRSDID